jgi:hypothetical protein
MDKNIITATIDYVEGHLRDGHIELSLNLIEFEKFKKLPRKIQEEIIRDEGEFIIDDWRIESIGDIIEINY